MSSLAARILSVLRHADGCVIGVHHLIDAVYGHRDDGGPDYADECVRQIVLALRKKGYEIEHVIGYRVHSRTPVELTARQRDLVEAIRSVGAESEMTHIAATIGMTRSNASCILHGARARGLVVERTSGYRLRECSVAFERAAA